MTGDGPRGDGWTAGVEPVERPVTAARSGYDRIAFVYDLAEDPFERRARRQGLALLAIRPGERVLEIGPGTGHALVTLASATGQAGRVIGVDLSGRMLCRARQRAARAGSRDRVSLAQGDAHRLPLATGAVDAVFMSFVLELIGTAQIPVVLAECHRVLAPGGRLGLVSLQLTQPPTTTSRLYLAARRHLPGLLDCRPIPVAGLLAGCGWRVQAARQLSVAGMPVAAVVATPGPASQPRQAPRPHR